VGTPCDDNDPTTDDSCDGKGVCVSVPKCSGVQCTALGECYDIGACEPVTGACLNPQKANGTSCSLGLCFSGVCANVTVSQVCTNVVCTAPSSCHGAFCKADGSCEYPLKSAGSFCDDQDQTTFNDVCAVDGSCVGTPKCQGICVDLCFGVDACMCFFVCVCVCLCV
jgi:hypothetical protein